MAITFRHDVAAGMIGAYASGQAARQRRGQKYGMDMLGRQQAQRQRLGAAGARRGAVAPMEGQWTDPLALAAPNAAGQPVPLEGQAAVTNRAAQKARARKYRLGEPIQSAWQPKFTSQAEIDADLKRQEQGAARQQDLGDEAWDLHVEGIDQRMPAFPDHLIGTIHEAPMRKSYGDEMAARGDRSKTKEQREEALDKIYKAREDLVAPSAKTDVEKSNEGLRFQLPDGTVSPERPDGEGVIFGHMQDGMFVEDEQSIRQREEATAKTEADAKTKADDAKAKADRRKQMHSLQGQLNKAKRAVAAAKGSESDKELSADEVTSLKDDVELIEEQMEELYQEQMEAAQPQAEAAQPPSDQPDPAGGVELAPPPPDPVFGAIDKARAAPIVDVPPPPDELEPAQPAPAQPAESTLPPDDDRPEPTGKGAEIAKAMEFVWRKTPDGQHGWTPPEGFAFTGPESSVAADLLTMPRDEFEAKIDAKKARADRWNQPPLKMPKSEEDLKDGQIYVVPGEGLRRFDGKMLRKVKR